MSFLNGFDVDSALGLETSPSHQSLDVSPTFGCEGITFTAENLTTFEMSPSSATAPGLPADPTHQSLNTLPTFRHEENDFAACDDLTTFEMLPNPATVPGSPASPSYQSLDVSPTFGRQGIDFTARDGLTTLEMSPNSIPSMRSAWNDDRGPFSRTWHPGTETMSMLTALRPEMGQAGVPASSGGRQRSGQMKVLLENLEPHDVEALVSGFWPGRSYAKLTMWNDGTN